MPYMKPVRGGCAREGPPQAHLPPDASEGKRWKFRRNAVIYLAHRNGVSQRVLADVFGLARSRVASIIKEFSTYESIPGRSARDTGPA